MINVKKHAIERFVERVLELPSEGMSQMQMNAVNDKILEILTPYAAQIGRLKSVEIGIGEYTYVIADLCVVTVKVADHTPKLRGGITKSGNKYAKKLREKRQHGA